MTIHKRRGSGTWWAWLWVAFVVVVVVALFAGGLVEFK
ncbi:MAG: hypothetical protein QOD53_1223 [Thermoleophilaceae bacterium]|jgi:hypothetical protein|nr:hypothetical protein [Thermoleophilaceae bacterium]